MYEGEESSRLIDTELSPPFAESTTNEFDDDDDIGYRRQPMATRTTTQYRYDYFIAPWITLLHKCFFNYL